jgi:hypothetical protein
MSGGENWTFFCSANDGMNNAAEWKNYSVVVSELTGWLNISHLSPSAASSQSTAKYSTLNVTANVTCKDGVCYNVTGSLKYNASSINPDTIVSNTTAATPLYVMGINTQPCGKLMQNQVCQLNFTINATGSTGTSYWLDVNFTSNATLNDSGDFQVNITPHILTPLSPINGTLLDRDSANASADDFTTLVVSTTAPYSINVTFKANLTNPSGIAGQTNLTLGSNVTNASGAAVLYWNPNITRYAGNYTWWAESNETSSVNGTRNVIVMGSFSVYFTEPLYYPNTTYTDADVAVINATMDSPGPESGSRLSFYSPKVNATILVNDATTRFVNLTISGAVWTGTYDFQPEDPFSGDPYNVSINASANYFYSNYTDFSRSFNYTVYAIVSITLFDAPINYSNTDPGTIVQATSGMGFPMIVRVDNLTTVNVDVYVRSNETNMTGAGTPIPVTNMIFANNSGGVGNRTLNTSFQPLETLITPNTSGTGKNVSAYWWLNVPDFTTPGEYSNSIIVFCNQSS